MELVNCYIDAVRRNLSADMRDEVSEELASNILSAQQEKESQLGRSMTSDETIELLNSFGHPEQFAGQYTKRTSLISSDWFPLYKQVLAFTIKLVAVFFVLNGVFTLLVNDNIVMLFLALSTAYDIFHTSVLMAVVVTACFYYLDGSSLGVRLLDSWRLGALKSDYVVSPYIPFANSFKHLAFAVLALIVVNSDYDLFALLPQSNQIESVQISTLLSDLLYGFSAVLAALVVLNTFNLLQPYWSRIKLLGYTLLMGALMILLLILVLSGDNVLLTAASADVAAELMATINLYIRVSAAILIGVLGYESMKEWRQFFNLYRK
ncbi:hypothetical protein [Pseudoalteromonas ardens]|uniref:Uncharacterized protein n=1 Tax=Pseudoalteromonas rubra TaxID=43658 RepID=A0A0L0ESA0_9GAMM|nr:hypothetical protein [Pseudoalteromonas sp. R96]KNC67235.1 hypothetical protein AC626_12025 [Pseudoalteromonas rubra]MDK1313307.1 hypothetical protein [Pseudoalteromonas sp. R96]